MPELNFPLALFVDFRDAFRIGAEDHPLDPETVRAVGHAVDLADAFVSPLTPPDHVAVLDLDDAGLECARMCFEVGGEGADDIPQSSWEAINAILAAPAPSP